MNHAFSTFETPIGEFSVEVDETGAVVATTFGGADRLLNPGKKSRPVPSDDRAAAARGQIQDYLAGRRRDFSLRLEPEGTPFQKRVWRELLKIPFGETRSYGEIATKVGSSPRAVGRAVGTNPVCLIVPCHRVIGADGSLTGFAFGLRIKSWLLRLEGIEDGSLVAS
jgi:methylated-DNA-[protein]-cysteine S-methyltransferase